MADKPLPKTRYECVSKPGRCRYNWNCGPLCECAIPQSAPIRNEQERQDRRTASHRQACWRWRLKKKEKQA